MTGKKLTGKTIALLVANGFSETQMVDVQRTITTEGGTVRVVSVETGLVSGQSEEKWGLNFPVDTPLSETLSSDYDMIIVLDGLNSVNRLQQNAHTKRILQGAYEGETPIVLLGHAVVLVGDFDNKEGVTVSVTDETRSSVEEANLMASDADMVIHGGIMSGLLDKEHQSILDHIVRVLSSEEAVKQAA